MTSHGSGNDSMPLIANLELTNRCNLRCEYCANRRMSRPRADMSLDTLALVFRRIDESGLRQVTLNTVGETLIAPHLREALTQSSARGLHVVVSTNGQLLGEDECELLLTEGCDVVRISANAADPETYESLHSGGSFDVLIGNVERFRAMRDARDSECTIRLRAVLPPDLGSRHATRAKLTDFWSGRVDELEFVTFGNMGGRNGSKPLDDERRVRCATIWRGFGVTHDGNVVYCPCDFEAETVLASLRDFSFREIWDSARFQSIRRAHDIADFSELSYCEQCDATRLAWYEMKDPMVSEREAEIMDAYLQGWRSGNPPDCEG